MRLSISMVKPEDKDSAAPNPGGPNPGEPREMDAFPEFFALHYGYLLKCCVKILGNMEDSEEIVQETFIRYLRKGHRFRGDSSVRTYLYRIAVNLCMNEIRRHRKRTSTPLHLCRDAADSPMPERELMWTVQRALGTLDPSLRVPLVLRVMEGMEWAEISGILKISESGARSRVFRAKKRLRARLERDGVE